MAVAVVVVVAMALLVTTSAMSAVKLATLLVNAVSGMSHIDGVDDV